MTASQCPDALDLITPKHSFSIYAAVPTFKKCVFLISFLFPEFPLLNQCPLMQQRGAALWSQCGEGDGDSTASPLFTLEPCGCALLCFFSCNALHGGNRNQSRSSLEVVLLHHDEEKFSSQQIERCLSISSRVGNARSSISTFLAEMSVLHMKAVTCASQGASTGTRTSVQENLWGQCCHRLEQPGNNLLSSEVSV